LASAGGGGPVNLVLLGVMTNPWLDVPLADYEGHMALPGSSKLNCCPTSSQVFSRSFRLALSLSLAALAETDLTEFRPLSHEWWGMI